MKIYRMYVCETCKIESKNHEEIELCEARHMGLHSLEDKRKWDELDKNAAKATAFRCKSNNEQTRREEDIAYEKLFGFEKEHNIYNQNYGGI